MYRWCKGGCANGGVLALLKRRLDKESCATGCGALLRRARAGLEAQWRDREPKRDLSSCEAVRSHDSCGKSGAGLPGRAEVG